LPGGGQGLARYILDQAELVAGKRFLPLARVAASKASLPRKLEQPVSWLPTSIDLHRHYLQEPAVFAFHEDALSGIAGVNSTQGW